MLMSVFNRHRDIALNEKRAIDEKRKLEALKRLQKSQKEKELESKPKLKELTDEEAEQLQKEIDLVRHVKKYIFRINFINFFFNFVRYLFCLLMTIITRIII